MRHLKREYDVNKKLNYLERRKYVGEREVESNVSNNKNTTRQVSDFLMQD